jgi:hypothetical protein
VEWYVGDEPGDIHEDVPFDEDGANALIAAFEEMAQQISDQRSTRRAAEGRALDRWQGQAVPLFLQRRTAGDRDAAELADQLQDAAEAVRALRRAARWEQARRAGAREWVAPDDARREAGGLWDDVTVTVTGITVTGIDAVFGDEVDGVDDEDREPPSAEPHLSSPSGTAQERA